MTSKILNIEKEPLWQKGWVCLCICTPTLWGGNRREEKDDEHRASHSGMGASWHAMQAHLLCFVPALEFPS